MRAGGGAAGNVSSVTDPSTDRAARLIVFEGVDAAGKTTQTKLLAGHLNAVATFQFGATALGVQLRSLVLDPPEGHVDNRAAALMIAADKAQHLADVVIPALQAGRHVVSDRFTASMLAYQGHGQGLPMGPLEQILKFSVGGLAPDLTVLLDIDPDTAARRRPQAADRFEQLGTPFTRRVRAGYLTLAAADVDRWAVIDAAADETTVAAAVAAAVNARLRIG